MVSIGAELLCRGTTNLGVMYVNGAGVDQSSKEAARWFQLAAEQGHDRAQNYLA